MTYINAISSISYQDFLENKSINNIKILDDDSSLIQPNYKQWIKPMQLRRMSKIVKMGIGCTKDIMAQLSIEDGENYFDSIIVGTGLGCIKDTVKFLDVVNSVSTSSIPPTAFIQSTHNTIAGQMALLLSNNSYNMTYVQNGVSFEQALLDGHLKITEGKENVLVGGVDEMIDYLKDLAKLANIKEVNSYTEGSAFFALSNKKTDKTYARLVKTMTYTCASDFDLDDTITKFLEPENLTQNDISLFLESADKLGITNQHKIKGNDNLISYEDYCGKYFTSSAFALFLACKILQTETKNINTQFKVKLEKANHILIINNYLDKHIGLTLITK
ncbi:MAG: beta-ketoacyl synthase chain length factor [Chitinophagales bacterium]